MASGNLLLIETIDDLFSTIFLFNTCIRILFVFAFFFTDGRRSTMVNTKENSLFE